MSILEVISTGISLIGLGQDVYDWVTGHTLLNRLDGISPQIEKLNDQLYLFNNPEIRDISVLRQNLITNDADNILRASIPLQQAANTNLIVSRPIVSPTKLKSLFVRNPEEVLFNIAPLKGNAAPFFNTDPTLAPVTFSKWGQEFIGYIKIGYLREFLDCEYNPQFANSVFPTISFEKLSTNGEISDFAFSPENKMVAGGKDGNLRIFDLRTKRIKKTLKSGLLDKDFVRSVAFNANGNMIAAAKKSAEIWDVRSGKRLKAYGVDVWGVSFSPINPLLLAFAMYSGEVILYNFRTDKFNAIFKFEPKIIYPGNLAFSPDGRFLACTAYSFVLNNRFVLLNVENHQVQYFLSGEILNVEFSPSGDKFATINKDKSVSLFDTETGKELLSLPAENSSNTHTFCMFTPDGQHIAYTIKDGSLIQFCDVNHGTPTYVLKCPFNVSKITFNSKGRFLAGMTYDGGMVLWSL
jgi:WD40 repeat protein